MDLHVFYFASGCLHLKSHCGIYASDPDAYEVFGEVFEPIIKEYHGVSTLSHPAPDFGNLNNLGFGDLDPKNEFINSTRIRVGRSHAYFGFPPTTSESVSIYKPPDISVGSIKLFPNKP